MNTSTPNTAIAPMIPSQTSRLRFRSMKERCGTTARERRPARGVPVGEVETVRPCIPEARVPAVDAPREVTAGRVLDGPEAVDEAEPGEAAVLTGVVAASGEVVG